MDTLGICLAAYYTTTPLTLASVLATDLLMALETPQFLVYIPSSLIVGAVIRLAVRRGYTRTLRGSMVSSFGVGVLSILAYTPVDLVLNDGLSMNIWGNALYDMLDFYGAPRVICILAGEAIVNIVDKQLCIFLAYLSGFLLWKFGVKRQQTLAAGLAVVMLTVVVLPVLPRPVQAEALTALTRPAQAATQPVNALFDFVPTIYDNTNGLPAAATTMVAHTPDGSIWVGGYAGLCRGDGSGFTYITEGRIANVTALLTDRQGKLWIGTNDQGLALWENERFRFISRKNGLPDNSVRTIFHAEDGSVYVGTADRLCRITEDGDQITPLDCEVRGVWDMAENDNGLVACVDYGGRLTLL